MACRAARRLSRVLGRRGAILLTYGTVWALYGYTQATTPPAQQPGLRLADHLMPLCVWGWLWMAAGAVAIVSAWLPQGVDVAGFVVLALIALTWMMSHGSAWLRDGLPQGWVGTAIWAVIAVSVIVVAGWREPPRPKRLEST